MDIVLINPPLSQEERYGVKFKAGGQTAPIGLAILAAVCREAGFRTAIIDAAGQGLGLAETVEKVLALRPKYVGLTAATISVFNARDVALELRKANPAIRILLGGAHITAALSETVQRMGPFFDVAVLGEGEVTIVDLLRALASGRPLSEVRGIAYRSDARCREFTLTAPRELIEDLDSIPFPAWDLLPDLGKSYCPPAHTVKRFPASLIMTSRGCPGKCTFCDNKVFGRRLRAHSTDYVIRLIRHLQEQYGIREFQIRDDNFLAFKQRAVELCQRLINEKIDVAWSCAGRVDMIAPDMLRLMKKAGCWQIWYGIESGSDRILGVIKKNTTCERIEYAVRSTKRAGISPCGFFMIGLPTETEDDMKATIDLLLRLPLDDFHIMHTVPLPGCELYRTAHEFGDFDNDWKQMCGWTVSFLPHGLSPEKLVYYSNTALKRFYFRPRIIWSYLKRIRSVRHAQVYASALMAFLAYVSKNKRCSAGIADVGVRPEAGGGSPGQLRTFFAERTPRRRAA
ncbi:MAG: radical SAM protein [Thermoguttaceae bacterium]|jgi:radical SAM superfamily enzyme YgiQ (UPF0313 family)